MWCIYFCLWEQPTNTLSRWAALYGIITGSLTLVRTIRQWCMGAYYFFNKTNWVCMVGSQRLGLLITLSLPCNYYLHHIQDLAEKPPKLRLKNTIAVCTFILTRTFNNYSFRNGTWKRRSARNEPSWRRMRRRAMEEAAVKGRMEKAAKRRARERRRVKAKRRNENTHSLHVDTYMIRCSLSGHYS